jgi:ABC-type antimicrobial peptide transport system ATPase subunit
VAERLREVSDRLSIAGIDLLRVKPKRRRKGAQFVEGFFSFVQASCFY